MTAAGLPDTTIIVAHSIGGLTARSAASRRPLKGILTIGTPHRGGPIADAVLNSLIYSYGALIVDRAEVALRDYDFSDESSSPQCFMETDPNNFCDGEIWFARAAGHLAQYLGAGVVAIPAYFVGDGALHSGGSLPDIRPSSELVSALNSSDNLYREALFIPKRVSLQSRYTGWTSPMWAFVGSSLGSVLGSTLTSWTESAAAEMLWAADFYRTYEQWGDPNFIAKTSNWQDWLFAGSALAGLDQAWCGFTGQQWDVWGCIGDGLFSLGAQAWTGSGATTDEIVGPLHTEEKGSAQFQSKAYDFLVNTFGVQRGEPTSGVVAYIAGMWPTSPGYYTYTAMPSGGNGSFAYQWQLSVDGSSYWNAAETGQSITLWLDYDNPLWLRVIVSSGGAQGTADRFLPAFSNCGGFIIC